MIKCLERKEHGDEIGSKERGEERHILDNNASWEGPYRGILRLKPE